METAIFGADDSTQVRLVPGADAPGYALSPLPRLEVLDNCIQVLMPLATRCRRYRG